MSRDLRRLFVFISIALPLLIYRNAQHAQQTAFDDDALLEKRNSLSYPNGLESVVRGKLAGNQDSRQRDEQVATTQLPAEIFITQPIDRDPPNHDVADFPHHHYVPTSAPAEHVDLDQSPAEGPSGKFDPRLYSLFSRGSKILIFMGVRFERPFPLYTWSVENKLLYAELHGYDFKLDNPREISVRRPTSFHKLLGARRYLPQYEWVCWFDIDTVVTDMGRRLDAILGCDSCDLVATKNVIDGSERLEGGTWCIRNSTWSLDWLRTTYSRVDFDDDVDLDVAAMEATLREHPEWKRHVAYVEPSQLSSTYGGWADGHFVMEYGAFRFCVSVTKCFADFVARCKLARSYALAVLHPPHADAAGEGAPPSAHPSQSSPAASPSAVLSSASTPLLILETPGAAQGH